MAHVLKVLIDHPENSEKINIFALHTEKMLINLTLIQNWKQKHQT